MTVIGGNLTFDAGAYTLTGGSAELDNQGDCPKSVHLVGNAAAAELRGSRTQLTLATQLTFVLVGQRARDYTPLRLS
jgi:hypothetical protein